MRRSLCFLCFVAVLVFAASTAYADSIQTFTLSGDLSAADAAHLGPVSGIVTIDTTTGSIEDFTLSDAGFDNSVIVGGTWSSSSPFPEFGETWLLNDPNQDFFASEDITLPTASLIGYAGGSICSLADPCAEYSFANYINRGGAEMLDGQLTPLGEPVNLVADTAPEPASLLLLGTGILFFAGVSRHRLVHPQD